MPSTEYAGDMRAGTLIIADDVWAAAAREAVEAGGGRLLSVVGWDVAAERVDRQSSASIVLAETVGVADGLLDRVLPRLDAMAGQGDARIVIALTEDQIDSVTAQIGGPNVALLCAPTIAERVGALVLAEALGGSHLRDARGEAESARLRRLNEEVARIAETLARLTRGDTGEDERGLRSDAIGDRTRHYAGPPAYTFVAADIGAREIRNVIRARRLRDQVFGGGLFEDPAWDMLLDLFAAELERAQVSVSSLCIAASVAPTTALRWIARMTEAGLFVRQPDPFDRRRAFMALSHRASTGMHDYVAATRRAGVAMA